MAYQSGTCRSCYGPCQKELVTPSKKTGESDSPRGARPLLSNQANLCNCERCGAYLVLCREEADNLFNEKTGTESKLHPGYRLSCMLRERYIRLKIPTFLRFGKTPSDPEQLSFDPKYVSARCDEILNDFPADAVEKIDRSLLNLSAMMGDKPGKQVTINNRNDRTVFYGDSNDDVDYMLNSLADKPMEYIRHAPSESDCRFVSITPAGWRRVRELTQLMGSAEAPVFVAMAFGKSGTADRDEQKSLYDNAIAKAVLHCGYKVKRADSDRHNDFIMNKMLGDIRAAPFVVADFTHNRAGVYFEAGFGRGLGRPVIHTCNHKHLGNLHFDTAQISHITWNSEVELYRELFHTIRSTVGTGPYKDQIKDAPEV